MIFLIVNGSPQYCIRCQNFDVYIYIYHQTEQLYINKVKIVPERHRNRPGSELILIVMSISMLHCYSSALSGMIFIIFIVPVSVQQNFFSNYFWIHIFLIFFFFVHINLILILSDIFIEYSFVSFGVTTNIENFQNSHFLPKNPKIKLLLFVFPLIVWDIFTF